jgi:hypothetical protein
LEEEEEDGRFQDGRTNAEGYSREEQVQVLVVLVLLLLESKNIHAIMNSMMHVDEERRMLSIVQQMMKQRNIDR